MSDEIQRVLGRIEGKLDTLVRSSASQERRIGALERWRAWTLGAAAAAGVIVASLWKLVTLTYGR